MGCQKRITYPALAVKFGDGKHRFYLESVCAASVGDGQKLCGECLNKVAQTKTQDSHTFPHGLVSGPYTKESHIFDSDWYKAKVATYGPPAAETLEIAMQAQGLARSGKGIRKPEDVASMAPVTPISEPEKPKPKRGGRQKAESDDAKPKEKKVSKPRAPKKVQTPAPVLGSNTTPESTNVLVQIQSVPLDAPVETMDDPIPVSDVIRVVLRPFSHNNVRYWRDGERDKVYKRSADGKRGPYVGRWCRQTQTLVTDAPDSDQE